MAPFVLVSTVLLLVMLLLVLPVVLLVVAVSPLLATVFTALLNSTDTLLLIGAALSVHALLAKHNNADSMSKVGPCALELPQAGLAMRDKVALLCVVPPWEHARQGRYLVRRSQVCMRL